jgi:RNA polymerase sigma factor (sigma-70 family)
MREYKKTGSHPVSVAMYQGRETEKRLYAEEKRWSVLNEDKVADPNINVADQAESQVTIQTSLQKLSPRQRQVIEMIYMENLTYEEAGQSLNLSHERIRQIKEEALSVLKRNNS